MRPRRRSLQSMEVNDLALSVLQWSSGNLGYSIIQIGLSSALFGILTSLVVVALFFLIRTRPAAMRILLPSTLLLYISTTLYMAAEIWHISSIDTYVSGASLGLFSASYGQDGYDAFARDVEKQSWMLTVALGINVLLGDVIVWWRACVVWRNRLVYCLGAVLLSVTVVCGSLGVYYTPHLSSMNALFKLQGNRLAAASAVLSFATNLFATSLIGYKAWEHRQLLRQHFREGHRQTRVLRGLALLVESGTIYCVLLAIVIVDQGVNGTTGPTSSPLSTFEEIEQDYTYDCFVPIVAIYPVLIIALIALDQSPIDSGFSQHHIAEESTARRRGGVMTSTVVFHHPVSTSGAGDGSFSSSDASSVGDAGDVRQEGSKDSDTPSRRVALEKGEDQKEKGAELV
ncbi:hypothetical protein GSI_00148 [Ganoderma sinense ZZ0214-1]|uniref:Uncharacterized protein n=1 Tax=Ganoderma sinense ZZ0214-1 TaxID=1077348 RepID=A0A2G8SRR3_9APHY|nr:hypothetical protein GSI_00148 [Ganoderma sinense ZZ0214-1]